MSVTSVSTAIIQLMEPKVDKVLLVGSGEHKILEVKKHWVASIWPLTRVLIASSFMAWATFADLEWNVAGLFTINWFWLFFALGLWLGGQATWAVLQEFRDRFVITNVRVFRMSGIVATDRASIPIGRLIDVTSKKTVLGKALNYGHLIFESAAQVQGLSEITYVKDVDLREQIILMAIRGDEMHEMVTVAEDDGT